LVFGFGDGVNTSLGIVSGVGGAAVGGGAVAAGFISSSAAIGMAIGLSLTSSFIVGAIKSWQRKIGLEVELRWQV
jgi:hypothetical protein